jgi:hypothetical protein
LHIESWWLKLGHQNKALEMASTKRSKDIGAEKFGADQSQRRAGVNH